MTFDPGIRPHLHYTPSRNWMNDPNGLLFHRGEYHLFFQHNTEDLAPGVISWGHAISTDLATWRELPVALAGTPELHMMSGSAVFDDRNDSGLGVDGQAPLIAMYTSYDPATMLQTQSLASSIDGGLSWTQYAGNPVIDIGSTEFRDPKIFRHDDEWRMVLVLAEDRQVRFYRSADLINWERLSELGPIGYTEGVWECPDLVQVPIEGTTDSAFVLLLSVQSGGPAGGSAMQYFVGEFDGVQFRPVSQARWFDFGADCYAAVSFADKAGGRDPIVMGWMSNWDYARVVPATEFRGSMTLPRRLSLRRHDGELHLVQRAILPNTSASKLIYNQPLEGRLALPGGGLAARIILEAEFGAANRIGLEVRIGGEELTRITVDRDQAAIALDRSRSGTTAMPDGFAAVHTAPLSRRHLERMRLEVIVDTASVEVFAGHGEVVLTDQILPSPESTGIAVFADGGKARLVDLSIAPL